MNNPIPNSIKTKDNFSQNEWNNELRDNSKTFILVALLSSLNVLPPISLS